MPILIPDLDGCDRCPQCGFLPEVEPCNKEIVLGCPRHGHIAMGNSLKQAIQHWNRYVEFILAGGLR